MSTVAAVIGSVFVLLWIWLMVDLVINEDEWLDIEKEINEEFWNQNT